MKDSRRVLTGARIATTLMMAAMASTAFAGGEATWSYDGSTGPVHWGDHTAAWKVCKNGRYQSPIDLKDTLPTALPKVTAKIEPSPLSFGFDGPTFAVPYAKGSWLEMNGTRYELKQFHFHHESEHTVAGRHYPMEAHLVLRSEGSLHNDAVLGIFIETGKKNAMLDQFWDRLPRSSRKKLDGVMVNVGDLLPESHGYYMYEGSMTTPGCPQSVRWFVFETPVQASEKQIARFVSDLTHGGQNNRPVQASFGRVVLKSR